MSVACCIAVSCVLVVLVCMALQRSSPSTPDEYYRFPISWSRSNPKVVTYYSAAVHYTFWGAIFVDALSCLVIGHFVFRYRRYGLRLRDIKLFSHIEIDR